MRRLAVVLAMLVAVLPAGCSLLPESEPEPSLPPEPVNISVFLRDDVTESQRQAIEDELWAVPGASDITFETREEAYERFKALFEDSPEMIESVRPEDLPESFRFRLADPADAQAVIAELSQLPGVDEVIDMSLATPSPPR